MYCCRPLSCLVNVTATLKGPARGKTKPLAGAGYDISEHSCQPIILDTGGRQQLTIQLEQQRKHANELCSEDLRTSM